MKTDIKSMNVTELEQLLGNISEKKYRAIQIFRWISGGVCEFDEMTNLPKDLREKLKEIAFIERLEKQKLQISAKRRDQKVPFQVEKRKCYRKRIPKIQLRQFGLHFFPGRLQDGLRFLRFGYWGKRRQLVSCRNARSSPLHRKRHGGANRKCSSNGHRRAF